MATYVREISYRAITCYCPAVRLLQSYTAQLYCPVGGFDPPTQRATSYFYQYAHSTPFYISLFCNLTYKSPSVLNCLNIYIHVRSTTACMNLQHGCMCTPFSVVHTWKVRGQFGACAITLSLPSLYRGMSLGVSGSW